MLPDGEGSPEEIQSYLDYLWEPAQGGMYTLLKDFYNLQLLWFFTLKIEFFSLNTRPLALGAAAPKLAHGLKKGDPVFLEKLFEKFFKIHFYNHITFGTKMQTKISKQFFEFFSGAIKRGLPFSTRTAVTRIHRIRH